MPTPLRLLLILCSFSSLCCLWIAPPPLRIGHDDSAAAARMMMMIAARAEPILAPELKYCHLPLNLPEGEILFDCCAPDWGKPAIDFRFDDDDDDEIESSAAKLEKEKEKKKEKQKKLKVRKPAHLLDEREAARLDKAYGLMKALPDDDPRSFKQQANIHCAYCSATYQMGNSSTPLQVHASWLFFAFHRWYLYFHERILESLLMQDAESGSGSESESGGESEGDELEGFALPFWNYDHPDGMTIPAAYVERGNLTDVYRDPSRLPPATVMVDYYYMNETLRSAGEQVAANLAAFHRMVVSGASTQLAFHGGAYRKGDAPEPAYGTVETMPHDSVHGWTGDHAQIGGKDMGTLYAAGRDPVFYAHHASIDRLWEAWKSLDGNSDISDPDYLASEFVFYNERAELVKVTVADSLDPVRLGYTYADVENLWLNATPPALSAVGVAAELPAGTAACELGAPLLAPCSLVLARPISSVNTTRHDDDDDGDDDEDGIRVEMVAFEGIEGVLDAAAHFDAFLNLPAANSSTPVACAEFVGRFSTLPAAVYTDMTGNRRNTSVRFPIAHNLRSLGLTAEDRIVLTVVPRADPPYAPVTVKSIRIYHETDGVSGSRRIRATASSSSSSRLPLSS